MIDGEEIVAAGSRSGAKSLASTNLALKPRPMPVISAAPGHGLIDAWAGLQREPRGRGD